MTTSARRARAQRPVRKAKQARARATVDAILEASARILIDAGWDGLSTNRVAELAGVSIGSLYEYFRDRHALIEALHERHLARGEALLAEASARAAPRDAVALVAMIVDGFVAIHQDNPRLHRVLSSGVAVSPAVRARIAALSEAVVDLVASALDGRAQEPRLAARLIVDTADALTHRWIVEPDGAPLSPERMATELTLMLKSYITGRMGSAT